MKKKPAFLNAFLGKTIGDYGWCPKTVTEDHDVVGIEIEFEGIPREGINLPNVKHWSLHEDGSLRGGAEYVSTRPRPYKDVEGDVERLQTAFKKLEFTPVFSFRTSLHVHVNVQDLTHRELLNMFALYTLFEQPLLELGGEERVGNVHCLPVFLASYPVNEVQRGLAEKNGHRIDSSFQRLMNNNLRYASFNWASIAKFGTVEFRSHRGTLDTQTITRWVNLLMELKHAAKHYESPAAIVQNFSSMGIDMFIDTVFTNQAVREICRLRKDALWEGLRNVQFFAFAAKDWTIVEAAPKPTTKTVTTDNVWVNEVDWEGRPVVVGDPIQHQPIGWEEMVAAQAARNPRVALDAQAALEVIRARRNRLGN